MAREQSAADVETAPPRRRAALAALLLAGLYLFAAAAAFHGYYSKWGFRENDALYGFDKMVDGTAYRPFVYRQFLPALAAGIERATPPALKAKLVAAITRPGANGRTIMGMLPGAADNPRYALRYHIIYYLCFGFLFASLFLMRALCLQCGASAMSAAFAPVAFAAALPVLLSIGGYFYDLAEVFFLFAAAALALSRRRWLLIPLALAATANKESFLFFLAALAPLIMRDDKDRRGLAILGAAMAAGALVYLPISWAFRANPGGHANFHLLETVPFYLDPLSLLSHERTYGLPFFAGYSILTVALVAALLYLGWRALPARVRAHALLGAAINLPLLLLLCAPGETRNLSLLYPALVCLIASAADRLADRTAPSGAD